MNLYRIQRAGGSYYVTIPKTYLTHLHLTVKDYVVVTLLKNKIEIEPLRKYPVVKKRRIKK